LLEGLRIEGRTKTDPIKLKQKAFSYPLKRTNYNFNKAAATGVLEHKNGVP